MDYAKDLGFYEFQMRRALSASKADLLQVLCSSLRIDLLGMDEFPDDVFRLLVELIRDARYPLMQGSWVLLRIFEAELESLSSAQKEELLGIFSEIYPKFSDDMGRLTVSEQLSQLGQDRKALAVWRHFASSDDERDRLCVPHGFYHLAREAADATIRKAASAGLMHMRQDQSESVRAEAEQYCRALEREAAQQKPEVT